LVYPAERESSMADRKSNRTALALLAGVVFVVLTVLGFVIAGEPPAANDSGEEVVEYFTDKDDLVLIGCVLEGLAGLAVLVFGSSVSRVMRRDDDGILPTLIVAASAVLAAGVGVDAALRIALVDVADDLEPSSIQTMNAIWSNFFFPMVIGMSGLILAIALSAMRTRIVPVWMAWIGVALCVVFYTPAGFVAFLVGGLWIAIASVLIWRRESARTTSPGATAPLQSGAV
jgi:hypothetical protein